jgi:hypothetical protein
MNTSEIAAWTIAGLVTLVASNFISFFVGAGLGAEQARIDAAKEKR